MVQYQLKLKLTPRQERELTRWLRHLAAVWNWSVKKIEHDAAGGIYYSSLRFRDILKYHGKKMGLPQDVLQGTLWTAHTAWQRCFQKVARKPRLKGRRNKLNSIAFAHGTVVKDGRIHVQCLGKIRFHKQHVPEGHIGQFRIVKRASGWYACLFIKTELREIPRIAHGQVGIDPGFNHLLTLSNGESIAHPRELEASASRLAQSQRGHNHRLIARLQERTANQRKDRNHKLSRRLVSENVLIAFSADDHSAISRRFGKSVASSGHYQIRSMLRYKSRAGGSVYVEPDSRNSTITCSTCGALSGPRGLAGLKVRTWQCVECGTLHDRDHNASMNVLTSGAGLAHEMLARAA